MELTENRTQATQSKSQVFPGSAPVAHVMDPPLSADAIRSQRRHRRSRSIALQRAIACLDISIISAALYGSSLVGVRPLTSALSGAPSQSLFLTAAEIAVALGFSITFWLRGLYAVHLAHSLLQQVWIILSSASVAIALFATARYLGPRTGAFSMVIEVARAPILVAWLVSITLLCLMRLVVSAVRALAIRRGLDILAPALVVGSSQLGKVIMQRIAMSPSLGYRMIGFVQEDGGPAQTFGRFSALGAIADLDALIQRHRVELVIITLPAHQRSQIQQALSACERAGAGVWLAPDLDGPGPWRVQAATLDGIPLINVQRKPAGLIQYQVKRALDIAGALLVIIVGMPLWLLIALAIKLDSPGPVFYVQTRLGYRGQSFPCFKFRSMCDRADEQLGRLLSNERGERQGKVKVKDDPRRTRIGKIIRRISLDEIPQALNVLRGEMSLIGPRPMPAKLESYETEERKRFEMLPGITGLWQISGRSDLGFDEMVQLDIHYIENWNLALDLRIALRTIPAVLSSEGAF